LGPEVRTLRPESHAEGLCTMPGFSKRSMALRIPTHGSNVTLVAMVFLVAGGIIVPLHSPTPRIGVGTTPTATGSVSVMATADYQYQPDTFEQVPINATISVTFTDADVLAHSFTISSREGFVIPTSYKNAQLEQLFTTYPALYSSFVNSSGDQSAGSFHSPPAPGWYEFVCNVSGHFQDGMYGFIAFGENLPSNLTAPGRVGLGGTQVTPLDAVLIGGTVVVLVLGIAYWRRRRMPSAPPSEPAEPSQRS